ncbi:MAG: NAD(P)H-nitrite reductase [Candidatus Uhrbacteria bacterium GW2011_GWF2_39_13]|uniref:NAD(P)H-nitrite reductase n=1 Tax=Candidatus Uhrbacteria bacterium GW2011_GWF2_39_13 TaxID=1618995 RepID=A0A0G0QRL0_9BACT|nr:MAG: NAD(P)H-nitrite reductase [Candidatus Uhrbacteria bacterium GW2011_GWF2_39_13]
MNYLIIGGGIAGTTAAEELRKHDPQADITLVSEEYHPLYSRVLLSHYIKGKIPRERVFLKKEQWYAQQRIEWLPGVIAQHLDPRNKFVGLSNGREYPYDKLLIATGAQVRSIEDDAKGVSYFRTLDDADHFLQLVMQHQGIQRGAVYGSGFIACEYINLFHHFNIPTTLVYRGNSFWNRILEPVCGELITRYISQQGVELHPNEEFRTILGEKELEGFTTNKQEYSAHILGIGIGIEPQFFWLKQAGVEVNLGIRANEYLETSVPDIFTAGDVAEFFDPIVGRQLSVGNWMNAMSQARVVAKNMIGIKTPFNLVSSYATNILGLEIIFVADVDKASADQIHFVGSFEQGGITQVFERNGQVVGGVMIGRNKDRAPVTQAIGHKHSWVQLQEELLF